MAHSTKFSRSRLMMAAGLIAMGMASPALADVKAGVDAWERGEFDRAVAEWRDPAAGGDADAQFNLGQAYKLGRGVPMDLKLAESWYKKAADKGHVQAADNYGLVLFQDNRRDEAMPYIRASSVRGEPRAQYVLGTAMFNGDIAEKDWVRAYALMTRASAQGLPQASRSLATMDKYIPLADRTKGTQLAAELEREATSERRRLASVAGGLVGDSATGATSSAATKTAANAGAKAPPLAAAPRVSGSASTSAPPSTIQTTSLPPSNATGLANPPVASSPTSTAASAGVDFATMGTPSAPTSVPTAPTTASPPPPAAPAQRAPAPAPTMAAASIAPAAAASGDWRIQLGAFSEEGRARTLWSGLERQNAALTGLQPYLVKAGTITKLQVGPFASQTDAKKACDSVARSGQACFVLKK
ncbi:SPOR domain-containing protein [Blastomonas sp.]|uniref:SPOR domain-containing protein n=1 Tax=Blastomonas sp. TaxID=1909299 RepID=UPI0026213343|nr:SPOR domain-containing protein [Blastomonas sp.]MDM7955426.1 SPOR domain-containing protein [Blastomonas sp.]